MTLDRGEIVLATMPGESPSLLRSLAWLVAFFEVLNINRYILNIVSSQVRGQNSLFWENTTARIVFVDLQQNTIIPKGCFAALLLGLLSINFLFVLNLGWLSILLQPIFSFANNFKREIDSYLARF